MNLRTLPTLAGAVALAGFAQSANAAVDVSINTAAYAYVSYDSTGAIVPGDVTSLGGDGVSNNDTMFWTATTTFDLTSTAQTLSISDLAADDSTVVLLNGTEVASAGIFGPGNGYFIDTPTGTAEPHSFLGNGVQSIDVGGPFNLGLNTIELIVDNNYNGIYGQTLTNGPSSLYFTGLVSPAGVPEPASWAMMLIGFGGLGLAFRSRGRAVVA